MGGGQLQVSSWENAVSDPRGKASGTLGRRTRLVWAPRSSVKGNFGIPGDSCFYNAVLMKSTTFNLTAIFWLDGLFDFFSHNAVSRGFGKGIAIG